MVGCENLEFLLQFWLLSFFRSNACCGSLTCCLCQLLEWCLQVNISGIDLLVWPRLITADVVVFNVLSQFTPSAHVDFRIHHPFNYLGCSLLVSASSAVPVVTFLAWIAFCFVEIIPCESILGPQVSDWLYIEERKAHVHTKSVGCSKRSIMKNRTDVENPPQKVVMLHCTKGVVGNLGDHFEILSLY